MSGSRSAEEHARRIDAALGEALAAAGEDEALASFATEARAALTSGPHRYERLAPEASVAAPLLRLEGVLNLRLAVMHTSLNPLEVGRLRAADARRVLVRLDALERELAIQITDDDARLRYDTLRFLHPSPPFTGVPADDPGPRTLPALVDRWEAVRARPEPFLPWLGRKAKQHWQFWRIGLSFPLYAARMRRIRRALPKRLADNAVARDTFHALEQLGPILDNFVFDRGPSAAFVDDVAITDFAFLYMQLADELVDNLVKLGGAGALARLLDAHYGQGSRGAVFVPLEDLTPGSLSKAGIDPESPIAKYGMSVAALVAALAELRGVLLARLDRRGSTELRAEVSAFFHHCFATFLDELELPELAGARRLDLLPYAEVAFHFHRKNHEVMTRWMVLRARVLGLSPIDLATPIARWGVLLASFQIFDDMKDVAVDLGHQPSYAIELAHRLHPRELDWLETTFGAREHSLDRNDVTHLNVAMAGTIRDCMRWSRLLALASYDWFLDYVSDYRWRRNWLVRARSFHAVPKRDIPIESGPLSPYADIDSGVPIVDALFRFAAAVFPTLDEGHITDEGLAFALDAIAYDHDGAIHRALFPDIPAMYAFANLRMRIPSAAKAQILRHVVAKHRAASIRALCALRASTGSTDQTFRLAHALHLPVPSTTTTRARRKQ